MVKQVGAWRLLKGMALLLVALGARAELRVDQGYVRGLPPGQSVTAAFMTLHNDTEQDVVLTTARSPAADKVEFHQHSHEDGMMRMRQVAALRVPAGGEVVLAPGHLHLMLIGLQRTLQEGDTVSIALCDSDDRCQTIELAVVSVLNE